MTKPFGSLTDEEVQRAGRVELRRVVVTDDVESWDLVLYAAGGIEPSVQLQVDQFDDTHVHQCSPAASTRRRRNRSRASNRRDFTVASGRSSTRPISS